MTYNQAISYINSFTKSGAAVKDLSRIAALMQLLGNPQDKLKFVHIAGTNGKGSTLELSSQSLINAGYKTGQFTSPFILCYEDRIRINSENIPQEQVARICERVAQKANGMAYSQFEITFAIAILYFAEEKCDIVFLETGIGGLLDATNLINAPLASVITSISYDHIAILGSSLEEIAMQKAGIIKPSSPVILSADNSSNVVEVIHLESEKLNSKFIVPDLNEYNGNASSFRYKSEQYTLKMVGLHQHFNALTVLELLEILKKSGFERISTENVKKAFSSVQVGLRAELINEHIIIDGAHNTGGIAALADVIKNLGKKPVIAVTGMLKTKDYSSAISLVEQMSDIVICVDGFDKDNVEAKKLSEMLKKTEKSNKFSMSFSDGFAFAEQIYKNMGGIVLICGSIYLASMIKKNIQ